MAAASLGLGCFDVLAPHVQWPVVGPTIV
jgi:hypothetical protein